jgi:hypothetical protein
MSLNQIIANIIQNAQLTPFSSFDVDEPSKIEEIDEEPFLQQEPTKKIVMNEEELMEINEPELIKNENKNEIEIEDSKLKLHSVDLSSAINISNDLIESNETDYKKMSIQKLRTIVLEKQLTSSDPSKMKKPELLKLLNEMH